MLRPIASGTLPRGIRRVSLTAEQLQQVRAERWRHIANPLLTADDAREWLNATGLTLFLPRRQQFLAPAPSFVEACAGAPSETPSREAIDNAASLMHRLVAESAIIPLNLFGTPSETPDFLATREAFPYLFSLRGTRDWKTAPGGKTSPLVLEIWKQLDKESAMTAGEIQSALGRELTEAAVLRGLMELWSTLRVIPEFEGSALHALEPDPGEVQGIAYGCGQGLADGGAVGAGFSVSRVCAGRIQRGDRDLSFAAYLAVQGARDGERAGRDSPDFAGAGGHTVHVPYRRRVAGVCRAGAGGNTGCRRGCRRCGNSAPGGSRSAHVCAQAV